MLRDKPRWWIPWQKVDSLHHMCRIPLQKKCVPPPSKVRNGFLSFLALKRRYINKTQTESGVEKSLFQFSLRLLI